MATPNESDPRLSGKVLVYDFKSIKAAIESYTIGWPNITTLNFEQLGKTNEVVELLKHLPYIRKGDKEKGYVIAFGTYPINYSSAPFGTPTELQDVKKYNPDTYWEAEKINSWVVPLTFSEDNVWGSCWLLDTTDGTVTDWAHNDSTEPSADYDIDDPRAWRNTCGETRKLEDLLMEWKKEFESLRWVAFGDPTGREKVWMIDDLQRDQDTEECEELGAIIRKHGWPNTFKRQECKEELNAWIEAHQED